MATAPIRTRTAHLKLEYLPETDVSKACAAGSPNRAAA